MSRHEGVSCDSCLKGNFRGRRYKCLVCYDYDLCEGCFEAGATNTRHTTDHPVQCILTRADFDLFYAGEAITNVDQPQAYTCPYCSRMGFTDATLQEHVAADHSDTSFEVVCPVCAAMPGGDPNLMTDDFAGHLTLEHRTGPRDLISFLDEPVGSTRHNVRRVPHSAHLPGGRGGQSTRPRRSNMHFRYCNDQLTMPETFPLTESTLVGDCLSSVFSSAALSSLSPSSREPVDPIAELLSQLSGVRRSASSTNSSTPNQLQQLQMQLQLERQQISAARQQLERLPRRQNQSQTTLRESSANSNPGYSLLMNPASAQAQPIATAPPVPSPPSNFLLEGLLEELSLQSSSEENYADRCQFASGLLLGTMTSFPDNPDSDGGGVSGSDEPSLPVSWLVPSSELTSTAATTNETNTRPATSQRVLRGRARSDGHNALRRADANKASVQETKATKAGPIPKTAISR